MEIASLERIGLTKQEASVYVSSLKLGLSKASEIAQKSGVKREASYYILKMLQEKGFVSEVIKSGVKYYSAIPPKRILGIIDEEKARKSEAIKELIPELESLQKIALERPKVELYEGSEGMKTAASIMIQKENQTIYCYFPEKILHFIPYFHPQFRRKRKEKNVKMKVITEETEFMRQNLKKNDIDELRETRFNNSLIKGMDSAFYILSDGIIIIKANEKEQMGIYIKEQATSRLQRKIFEEMWASSKK